MIPCWTHYPHLSLSVTTWVSQLISHTIIELANDDSNDTTTAQGHSKHMQGIMVQQISLHTNCAGYLGFRALGVVGIVLLRVLILH